MSAHVVSCCVCNIPKFLYYRLCKDTSTYLVPKRLASIKDTLQLSPCCLLAGFSFAYNARLYNLTYYPDFDVGTWLSLVSIFGGSFGVVAGGLISDAIVVKLGVHARLWLLSAFMVSLFNFVFLNILELNEKVTALNKNIFTDWFHHSPGNRLIKKYWGQGYATEASKAWLAHGFNTMNLSTFVLIQQGILLKRSITLNKKRIQLI